jgi:hypothetical protein
LRSIRTAAVFAALMLAATVAAPSVGAFDLKVKTGDTGFYTVPDDHSTPGAVCRYENNPGRNRDETNKVSTRQLWTHGPWEKMTWVGHKVIVMKRKNSASSWKIAWKSSLVKKKANDTAVAFFGARHYKTPENHAKQYRVVHQLTYYEMGSKTHVAGKVRGSIESYKHVMVGKPSYAKGDEGSGSWCQKRYWPVPI